MENQIKRNVVCQLIRNYSRILLNSVLSLKIYTYIFHNYKYPTLKR